MANSEFEKLIAECLAAIDAPLPEPCRKDKNCIRAGGCYYCMVVRPREREFDRRADAEMRKRQKKDPAFLAEQRRWVAQLIEEFGEPKSCAGMAGGCPICRDIQTRLAEAKRALFTHSSTLR